MSGQERQQQIGTFACPGCGDIELPDEVGIVVCDECGATIETTDEEGE